MHKWTHSAAGGTIQRLNPGFATVRLLSRKLKSPPESVCSTVVIVSSRFLFV
jgi:hypothetical protein